MMAISPRPGNADLVSIDLEVDGRRIKDVYRIAQIQVTMAINPIPVARIMILDGSAVDRTFEVSETTDFIPGGEIVIKAGYHQARQVIFTGVIVKHGIKMDGQGRTFLVLTCKDRAVRMTIARSSERYVKKKDSDVITGLIRKAGLKADVEPTKVVHELLVKQYSSDWDYIVTRAEVNGQLVIVDGGRVAVKAPAFKPPAELVVRLGDTVADLDAEIDALSQLPTVTSRAWDPAKQQVASRDAAEPKVNKQGNIDGKALVKVLDLKDFELQSFAPLPLPELQAWANAQLLKSRLSRLCGRVSFPGNNKPKPGQLIELEGLGARFNGSAFISSVRHTIGPGEWITQVGFGLSPHWFAGEHAGIEAPPAAGLRPGVGGLQIATVKQIHDDPAGERRIKVSLPMMAAGDNDIWVRLASPYAGSGMGICFLPEPGDEVVLGFLNDDPVAAIVLGSLHSKGRAAPCVPDEKNRNKAIVTSSQMKISFDDVDKNLQIETPGGQMITLSDQNQSITITDSNKNKIVMDAGGISLDSPKDITLKAGGSVQVEATAGIDLKTQGDVGIQGMNTNITADVALAAKGQASAELSASGQTTVKGAMVMIN
jgi:Rhs element Vgr protein